MSDVIEGAIAPSIANAAVNAGGKLLKVTELQYKYGKPTDQGGKTLPLFGETGVKAALAQDPRQELLELKALAKQIAERMAELKKAG